MLPFKYPVPQTDPPPSPRETLPTMYDLPSEDPEKPGLRDEFHDLQPQLLSLTFRPRNYPASEIFSGTDMNLYYDVHHTLWHKRPDWFGVVGVPRLYDRSELRMSYVTWPEGVNPFVIVELRSEIVQTRLLLSAIALLPKSLIPASTQSLFSSSSSQKLDNLLISPFQSHAQSSFSSEGLVFDVCACFK